MKRLITLLLFSVLCLYGNAQVTEPSSRRYYDKQWKSCSQEQAAYFRDYSRRGNIWIVKDYYITQEIQMTGSFSDDSLTVKEGYFEYFHLNGQRSSAGYYRSGKAVGEWSEWHEDGSLSGKGFYKAGTYTGTWKWYFPSGQQSSEEEYLDGTIVNLQFWDEDGKPNHTTQKVEQMPEYPGGVEKLMHFLSTSINYPKAARKKNIEGRVILQFLVGVKGEISNVEVIKSVDELLDAEAVRVVRSMPDWTPGLSHNRPLVVKFTLPILFRLN